MATVEGHRSSLANLLLQKRREFWPGWERYAGNSLQVDRLSKAIGARDPIGDVVIGASRGLKGMM